MRKRLFECCVIIHLDINMLLDAKQEDDYRKWRDLILSELETYVDGTKRITTRDSRAPPNTARVYASKYQCVKKIHARKFGLSGLKYRNHTLT